MNYKPKNLDGFTKICTRNDLQDKIGKRFVVDDTEIAVFLIENKIFAVNNICPHMQSALIYDGFIEGEKVVCPAHGWTFDLSTGKAADGGKGLTTYEVAVIEDSVYVKVEPKTFSW